MPNDMQPHSKTHTWILVLLFWVLAVTLFVAGYLLYNRGGEQMSAAELASACASAITASNDENSEDAPPTCPVDDDVETYSDTLAHPLTFDFPDTWNVYTEDGPDGTRISLSPKTFGTCTACGGYAPPVNMTITSEKTTVSDPAILAEFEANPHMTLTGNTRVGSGTLLTWTDEAECNSVGCTPGKHERWVAVKNTALITANYYKEGGTPEEDAAWELFLATVDVSKF